MYEAYSWSWATPPFNFHHVGGLFAYDAAGVTGCSQQVCNPLWGASAESSSQPSVASGVVYVASGSLRAFDAAGTSGCSAGSCSALRTLAFNGPDTSPTIAYGVVYLHDNFGLHAYTTPIV